MENGSCFGVEKQRLQVVAGRHGESWGQRERGKDPVQHESSPIGGRCLQSLGETGPILDSRGFSHISPDPLKQKSFFFAKVIL
jgi:hypothetical protein